MTLKEWLEIQGAQDGDVLCTCVNGFWSAKIIREIGTNALALDYDMQKFGIIHLYRMDGELRRIDKPIRAQTCYRCGEIKGYALEPELEWVCPDCQEEETPKQEIKPSPQRGTCEDCKHNDNVLCPHFNNIIKATIVLDEVVLETRVKCCKQYVEQWEGLL